MAAELAFAVAAGLAVLSFGAFDDYDALFRPKTLALAILHRLNELYSLVPFYRRSVRRLEEAYYLLGYSRPPWLIPSAMWTVGFVFVFLALLGKEPVLLLPTLFLFFYLPTYANLIYSRFSNGLTQGLLEFVDLVSVAVTAGLPLTSALENVANSSQSFFFREMSKVMQRIEQGNSLREELMKLLNYNKTPEFTTFIEQVSSLYETGGVNASEILMGLSRHLREMYALRIEKEVEAIQVKMILPLFLSLIGTLFLIGGPVMLYVYRYMFAAGSLFM